MPRHTLGSAGVDKGWVCTCGWTPDLSTGLEIGAQWRAHLEDEQSADEEAQR